MRLSDNEVETILQGIGAEPELMTKIINDNLGWLTSIQIARLCHYIAHNHLKTHKEIRSTYGRLINKQWQPK